jgi:PAS domain S-box-containing protein
MIGDLRGRKRAQAALRASEQQFRTLAANAPIGILLTRPGGELDFTNDRYSAITGLTLEDVSGKIWADVLHPDDRESVLAEWRLASTEGRDFSSEYRAIRPDGRVIWIHGRSAALRHEDGSITGFVGTVTDITHRKLAESERDRFFNLSLDMLSICDFHGKLRRFNPAWSDTLGSNVQELETVRLIDLVHEDDRAATENEIARLTRGGSITRFENRLRTRNGSYRWLSWNAASDMDHKLIYAIARDVTDARQLQEQLREKNRELERQNSEVETATRLKSKFLANMSHELRTPLNGIIGFAELMRDGHAGPTTDTHEEFLDDILMSSRHLLRLINDILDLSKVEADKIIFQPRKVDLPCLIREVHHTLRELAARNHVQLSLEIDTALTEVELDPDRLKQILYNYLANALKFTDAGGTVVVRANAVSRGMFRLEVEDTGIGVRPEDIPKLFTEFQQLDQSTSKKYQGTGLGLALTKRLVEAQGGSVGVSSRWGEGSTFYAILPIQAPLDGDRAAGRALADARRILVVGRREILNASFCDSLRGMSIDTRIVDRGTEAMEVTSTEDFDAIVLDVEVPDMDALELLRAIRATDRHKATPVIALTPTGQTSRALGLPVQGSVEKPLDPARLVAALERAGISTPGRVSSLGTEASRST